MTALFIGVLLYLIVSTKDVGDKLMGGFLTVCVFVCFFIPSEATKNAAMAGVLLIGFVWFLTYRYIIDSDKPESEKKKNTKEKNGK